MKKLIGLLGATLIFIAAATIWVDSRHNPVAHPALPPPQAMARSPQTSSLDQPKSLENDFMTADKKQLPEAGAHISTDPNSFIEFAASSSGHSDEYFIQRDEITMKRLSELNDPRAIAALMKDLDGHPIADATAAAATIRQNVTSRPEIATGEIILSDVACGAKLCILDIRSQSSEALDKFTQAPAGSGMQSFAEAMISRQDESGQTIATVVLSRDPTVKAVGSGY